MALMELTFRSEALGFDQSINVLLPEPKDLQLQKRGEPYREGLPVLYLFHGYSDNHTAWLRRSNVERYLHHSAYNMICVLTNMGNFWYTDMAHGYRYQTFIGEELPNIIESTFRASTKREDRFIAGLSMGGYGALYTALQRPERYAAAASLSGAVDVAHLRDSVPSLAFETRAVFDVEHKRQLAGTTHDLRYWIDKHVQDGTPLPKLYQSCGQEDALLENNRGFHQYLLDKGVAHTYFEQPGMDHEWDFWDSEIRKLINDWLPIVRR